MQWVANVLFLCGAVLTSYSFAVYRGGRPPRGVAFWTRLIGGVLMAVAGVMFIVLAFRE